MAEQTIDRLAIEISADASKSANGIDRLTASIQNLRDATAGSTTNLSGIAKSIAAVRDAFTGTTQAASNAKSLTSSIQKLRTLSDLDLTGTANSIRQFASATSSFKSIGDTLQPVKDFSSSITKFKNAITKLNDLDLKSTPSKIQQLVNAIKPLTDEMMRAGPYALQYGQSLKDLASAMRTINNAGTLTGKLTQGVNNLQSTFKKALDVTGIFAFISALRLLSRVLSGFIDNINSYIEDMNLFMVSLGDSADEAQNFAMKMQNLLGINAGDAMRNMGLFNNLTESFGATSEQAYILSKNLTQLGFDLSSFFNISTEDAFQKLQAGIAGEQTCLTQSEDCVVICLNRGTSKRLAA